MCGRFSLTATLEDLFIALKINTRFNLMARYNIAPGQPILAARLDEKGGREFTHFQWGLIPGWMKAPPTSTTLINARMETVAEKPSFRNAYKRRRCLVPASGFYEWQKTNGPKQPHYIYLKDHLVMTFAGIWEHWQGPDGLELETAAILTAPASKSIAALHERMPLVVSEEDHDGWLRGEKGAGGVLNPEIEFKFYPVSRAVNNIGTDNKSLIENVEAHQEGGLL